MIKTHEKGHLKPFLMLKPKADVCQECACNHKPEEPHNKTSMAYQYYFYNKHGRLPTWADAMAHCSDEVKEHWINALKERGVKIND